MTLLYIIVPRVWVTVELSSPNLQGGRTAVTGNDGRYRFVALPPGRYTVTGNLSGFGNVQKTANVGLDKTSDVNLQLSLATKESVTVTGEAPIVDVTSTTTGSNYTAKVMDKLPLGRNYASIVLSQPGVQTDNGETQGRSLALSIYGSTSAENLFLIDGVNTTNVIKGFQGKNINTEFIQEVEVKTGGYQAEYGRNTGGVVNVITKSGGNEFHGDVFGYYNTTSMRSDVKNNQSAPYSQGGDALTSSTTPKLERKEGGVDLGGFFWRDRIWFYGAYDRTITDQDVRPTGGPVAGQDFPIKYTESLAAGKLTFNIAQGSTLVGTFFADPRVQEGALLVPAGTRPTTYNGRRDVGGTDYAARYNQLFGAFGIFTAQYSQHKDRYQTKPEGSDLPRITDVTPATNPNAALRGSIVTGGFGNVFGPTLNNSSKRDGYQGSFTAYFFNNELKFGGDYQKDDTFGSTFRTGGQALTIRPCTGAGINNCDLTKAPFYTNPLGQRLQVFYQHGYYAANGTDLTPLVESPFDTPTKRYGAFVQDSWRITPSLSVNAGVRWDQEEFFRGDQVTAFKLNNQWAPRFGFVWDFVGDGSSKVYGSVGRFFYAIPTDLNARVFTGNTAITVFNYSPTDIGTQDPTAPAGRNRTLQIGSVEGEPVDPGIKAPYQDELTLGVEKALDPTLSVGIKGTYRSLGRAVEDRCDLAPAGTCAIFNPGSSGPGARGVFGGYNGSANPTDPFGGKEVAGTPVPDAKRIFRGIELTARKAFSQTLWLQASYLYSSLRGNYSGAIREASGQTDPGINADYDYNQFLINSYGNLELDRPHQFRLDAVYNTPFGLAVGVNAYIRSGVPTSRQGYFNSQYSTELFLDQRGSNGRLPTDYEANLSLAYNINIGKVTITPQLYVFNVLNRQTVVGTDTRFNPNGSFVTNRNSPFYGQAGVEPGTTAPDGTRCTSSTPCTDNPDYRKASNVNLSPGASARVDPRLFRAALKISF
ncbi:MAG: TonB-dependent receptor [Acidobacteria bacterium]|nr:TonB-dependent receptor [Acidobacteriota bacterium]